MSDLDRLLDPGTIAIVGLSADSSKHGARVLHNLRKLGYGGEVWGVNPRQPRVDGVQVFPTLTDLPQHPDLVISAIPAAATVEVAREADGVGALVAFAGGFAESGPEGRSLEQELRAAVSAVGARLLGPNSGGVIRPAVALAASFLTCLDRPVAEIRSGPVGVVTQSGGTGSYLHNLAAARGGGLGVSVSTGNETDIKLGEAIGAVADLEEVTVILAVIETVRDGDVFMAAIKQARARGKRVVACRLGVGRSGRELMGTHTGAMALPGPVLDGVLQSLGVAVAETPGEALEIAEILARVPAVTGDRVGIVTHSGGMAIHLADLAEREGLVLPPPGDGLRSDLEPLLDHGAANNPLDMGGIIAGPNRYALVVEAIAGSGDYDVVLAVSSAHPPAHSEERVKAVLELNVGSPIIHLWMAGDQADSALEILRAAGAPVTEEPRAAIRAIRGLISKSSSASEEPLITGPIEDWGLPLVDGRVVATAGEAVAAAEDLGYPVVVKLRAKGLAHKTEMGGVVLDLIGPEQVKAAFTEVMRAGRSEAVEIEGARVEPFRPGLEMIVGGVMDETFGPLVSVGLGGTRTELWKDVVFAPAPISEQGALDAIDRLRGRAILDGWRDVPPADLEELARLVSRLSRGLAGSRLTEVELNPLIWDGREWVAVDWLAVAG